MKKLAILSAVAAFGVLGFVGPASASNALDLERNQRIILEVECFPTAVAGQIDVREDAFRQGGGPPFPIENYDCITNVVQSHSPGGGAPATDSLGGDTIGTCTGTGNAEPMPVDYFVQAICGNVPDDANTIGVESVFEIQTDPKTNGFIGLDILFRCNIPNTCPGP